MLQAIDALPDIPAAELPGVYLEVRSRVDERLKKDSLDASCLMLLRIEDAPVPGGADTLEIAKQTPYWRCCKSAGEGFTS